MLYHLLDKDSKLSSFSEVFSIVLPDPFLICTLTSRIESKTSHVSREILLNLLIFILLSDAIKNTIRRLLEESHAFNRNDVLVHASETNAKLFFSATLEELSMSDFPNTILKEARKTQKESGVNALCRADAFLLQGERDHLRRSPIFLTPAEAQLDRVRERIRFEFLEEARFVNPYIAYVLKEKQVDVSEIHPDSILSELTSFGFEVEREALPCIGNFHHHRYAVLRELEALISSSAYSPPLQQLLGDAKSASEALILPPDLLFPADVDHEVVFETIAKYPTVIQGPPGTGKSQVLANILGKLLAAKKSAVVLSEKRAALEVLLQKLHHFGLDRLGYIVTSEKASQDLLRQVETNWHYFEQEKLVPSQNIRLSEQYEAQLQFSLDLLNQPDAVGGISLYEFLKWKNGLSTSTGIFVNDAPDIPTFDQLRLIVEEIYQKQLQDSIGLMRHQVLQKDDFETIQKTLEVSYDILQQVHEVVSFDTWKDFTYIMQQASLCQILENDTYKKYLPFYTESSRKQKQFLKLYQAWNILQKKEALYNSSEENWIKIPTARDVKMLREILMKTSFIGRRRFAKIWGEFSNLPVESANGLLEFLEEKYATSAEKSKITIKFCELGIVDPETEIHLIHLWVQRSKNYSYDHLKTLSSKQTALLSEMHDRLHSVFSNLKNLLQLEQETSLLTAVKKVLYNFGEVVAMHPELQKFDNASLSLLRKADSFDSYEAIIANSHWSLFRKRFPALSTFSMHDLHEKAQSVQVAQEQEANEFSKGILYEVQQEFQRYHVLLNTPAHKLSEAEKNLKKRLRKGKSILVKEFSKTRSHPSVRELFASEAREWIQLLTPLWFSNPTEISKVFPLETALFDVALFDEASQIPVQHGLGALQRAKHGVVAGDSQQMGPSSYFKAGQGDVIDLLHQASFYWSSVGLSHHYRSLHPDLISFSNKHFYSGLLRAYPAFQSDHPIQRYFIEKGRFIDRKNELEAKAIAKHVEKHLMYSDRLGIVAFSEEQLNAIQAQLTSDGQQRLSERIEDGSAFFKSIENVQGDECDLLIVSFGYGKDENGDFAMRFGPMNTANGRRRLNVLLTRARARIDFFTSITSSDFKLSENESINLLRLWFVYLENWSESPAKIHLAYENEMDITENELTLYQTHSQFMDARELVTFQNVMEARGWQLKYS